MSDDPVYDEMVRDYFDDPPDDDRREDARREEADDRFDQAAVTCLDCGERWDPRAHPATRWEPGYAEVDSCPRCDGPPVHAVMRKEYDERVGELERQIKEAELRGDENEASRVGDVLANIQAAW